MAFARSLASLPLRRLASGVANSAVTRASVTATTRPSITSSSSLSRQQFFIQRAAYSASAGGLSKEDIETRVHNVLKAFEKVPAQKLSPGQDLTFTSDLGLDSLDVVEVVMAIEEEFSIEIADEEADVIDTIGKAIAHVQKTPQAI